MIGLRLRPDEVRHTWGSSDGLQNPLKSFAYPLLASVGSDRSLDKPNVVWLQHRKSIGGIDSLRLQFRLAREDYDGGMELTESICATLISVMQQGGFGRHTEEILNVSKGMLFRSIVTYEDSIPNIHRLRPDAAGITQVEGRDVGFKHTQYAVRTVLPCRN